MNRHFYRLVFNGVRRQVVADETARAVDGHFDSTPSPNPQNKTS